MYHVVSFFHRVSLFCTMSYHFSIYPISYPPLSCIIMFISLYHLVNYYGRLAEMMMLMMISVGGLHTIVVYVDDDISSSIVVVVEVVIYQSSHI